MRRSKNEIARKYERVKNGKPPRVILERFCIRKPPNGATTLERKMIVSYRLLQYCRRHDKAEYRRMLIEVARGGSFAKYMLAIAIR